MHSLTSEELQILESIRTFDELAELAIQTLERMKQEHSKIVQICGPMSTGGCGDFERNMHRFNRSIEIAVSHGVAVFNQILFQTAMIRICEWKEGDPYPTDLLDVFYRRVLSSGHITKGLFLPDWESSTGARWEWNFLSERGIAVEEYPWIGEIS